MKRKQLIIVIVAFVLIGSMVSALAISNARATKQPGADVMAANARLDNATYSVLSVCMKALPAGTNTCDTGVQEIHFNCLKFVTAPDSCSDNRIAAYLQQREQYKAMHLPAPSG